MLLYVLVKKAISSFCSVKLPKYFSGNNGSVFHTVMHLTCTYFLVYIRVVLFDGQGTVSSQFREAPWSSG